MSSNRSDELSSSSRKSKSKRRGHSRSHSRTPSAKSATAAPAAAAATAPAARRPANADDLVDRLHDKVGHDSSLSLTDHLSAGRRLCRLRDLLVRGERPTPRSLVKLLSAGTALHRRFAVGECGGGLDAAVGATAGPVDEQLQQRDLDDARALVRGTATRTFALLCALEMDRRMASLERGLHSLDIDEGRARPSPRSG